MVVLTLAVVVTTFSRKPAASASTVALTNVVDSAAQSRIWRGKILILGRFGTSSVRSVRRRKEGNEGEGGEGAG